MASQSEKSGKRGRTGMHGNHRRGPKTTGVVIACEVCGRERRYMASQLRVRKRIRFCSVKCRDSGKRCTVKLGRLVPRPEKTLSPCLVCGRLCYRRPCLLRAGQKVFCSPACRALGQRKPECHDPEYVRSYMRRWVAAHREELNEKSRAWTKANRSKKAAATHRYRARLKGASIGAVDFEQIKARDGMVCHICRELVTEATLGFDHVMPLSRGGAHTEENIAVCHRRCNSRKSNKLIEQIREI